MRVCVILFNDLCIFRDAKIAYSSISCDLDFVLEAVDEVVCILNTMPPVVWVEGYGKNEGVLATNDFQLLHDVNFERGGLSGE